MLDARFIKWKLDYTKIKDFPVTTVVSSEEITVGGQVWRFNCYPGGYTKQLAPEHLSIFLDLLSEGKNISAIFEAFMLDKNGKPSSSHARRCLEVYPANKYKNWGWNQFVTRSDLESLYMTNGMITIVCGAIVVCDDPLVDAPPADIRIDLGRLLDCAYGSDVSFVVNGETVPAHRAVLAARSPVFKAQLLGSMADAKMPSITMHDVAPVAFKAMLRYMYTDALSLDTELGSSSAEVDVFQDLLVLADRYALDRLKLTCATKLWENVSIETVGAILVCAETYNCPELKKKCIGFVAKEENFKRTVLTDGFLQLVQKFPSIIAEMREKFGS